MATAAGRHRASSQAASSPTMGYYHSQPTQGDMELLDLLTREDSAFPHAAASSSALSSPSSSTFPSGPVIAGKPRPLATLAALRRPPIDPIILAASLSSGPHVTRHHFHHSYGDKGHSKHSRQMPASQRKAAAESAEASSSQSGSRRQTHTRGARSQSLTGSYANCDLDDGEEEDEAYAASSAAAAGTIVEPSLADKYPERTLYPSKQAPRSVRLKREQEEKAAQDAREAAATGMVAEGSSSLNAAHAAEVAQSAGIRASNEEQSEQAPNASAPREDEATHGTKALLDRALSERQAIVSAPPTPPLSSSLQHDPFAHPQAPPAAPPALARLSSIVRPPPLIVRCYARTRIPTPHGEIFCHLYKNNHDAKEHMALVVDPAQNEPDVSVEELLKASRGGPRPLRSRTLDEVWGSEETDMERIVRGAYVGRLGPGCQVASRGPVSAQSGADGFEPPLVRIHSECYTGETIGSQRCDCGEQLDEALRLILSSGSGHEESTDSASSSSSLRRPRLPRGVVVYMRQEGRGIGLLDKLMAYNLQDMGHDTVSANVLLGHLPDARRYNIASAILQDLGIHECRLLTNNPEKMEALESEGIPVKERVAMVPRAWLEDVQRSGRRSRHKHKRRQRKEKAKRHERQASAKSTSSSRAAKHNRVAALGTPHSDLSRSILSQAASLDGHEDDDDDPHTLGLRHQGSDIDDYSDSDESSSSSDEDEYEQHLLRSGGATMIGGSATRSVELDRYLRTKIEKMGHLLDLPQSNSAGGTPASPSASGSLPRRQGEAKSTSMARGPSAGAGAAEEDDGHGTGTESLLDEEELRRLAVDDEQENNAGAES